MINLIGLEFSIVAFVGILFAFVFTCVAIAKFEKFLPRDMPCACYLLLLPSARSPRPRSRCFFLHTNLNLAVLETENSLSGSGGVQSAFASCSR